LEDVINGSTTIAEESQRRLRHYLAQSASHGRRALLLKTSHIGGHKLSGNVVIYSPAGRGIWYGRVKPEHVRHLPSLKATRI
jgi:hypothetical protein